LVHNRILLENTATNEDGQGAALRWIVRSTLTRGTGPNPEVFPVLVHEAGEIDAILQLGSITGNVTQNGTLTTVDLNPEKLSGIRGVGLAGVAQEEDKFPVANGNVSTVHAWSEEGRTAMR
jgi:hypothetical protein